MSTTCAGGGLVDRSNPPSVGLDCDLGLFSCCLVGSRAAEDRRALATHSLQAHGCFDCECLSFRDLDCALGIEGFCGLCDLLLAKFSMPVGLLLLAAVFFSMFGEFDPVFDSSDVALLPSVPAV